MTGRDWLRLLATRVLTVAVVLVVLSLGIFSLLYLAPGSVERTLLGTRPVTPESLAAIRAQYNLDDPFAAQYLTWLGNVLRGDLGISIRSDVPVTTLLADRLPLTLALVGLAVVLAALLGTPLGVLAAYWRGRLADHAIVATSVVGISAPPFALGLVVMLLFAVQLGWLPTYGAGDGGLDTLRHLVLPALTLAIGGLGLILRLFRTSLVTELSRDYVTFARARGLPERVVVGYAVRNSLVALITAIGLVTISTLVGTVLVETTFALPGIGTLLVDSVTFKDIPVVQALALLLAAVIAVVNTVVDVTYLAVDLRLRRRKAIA